MVQIWSKKVKQNLDLDLNLYIFLCFQDIYEATEFQPSVLSSGDVDANYKMFTCAMKFTVGCITATLQSKYGYCSLLSLKINNVVTYFI